MTSKKIGISQPWIFDTYPYNPALLNQQKDISSLFYDIGIIPSEIHISQHKYLSTYHLSVFITKKSSLNAFLLALKVLKPLLVLKYNKNVTFNIKYPPSLYYDHNHIASWLKLNLQEEPIKIRPFFKKLMSKQNLTLQGKKMQSRFSFKQILAIQKHRSIQKHKRKFTLINSYSTFPWLQLSLLDPNLTRASHLPSRRRFSFNTLSKRIFNFKKRPLKNQKSFFYYKKRTFQNLKKKHPFQVNPS
jgi:hypothetical protein